MLFRSEVYETPNSRYVADFIGDVNLFEGAVTAADGKRVTLATPDCPAGFEALEDDLLAVGSTAWLGVRPEKIQLHLDPPKEGSNRMAGKVADYGYLGDWTTYVVELESGRTVRAARANASRLVARPIACDDPCWLTFAPDAAVVLTR